MADARGLLVTPDQSGRRGQVLLSLILLLADGLLVVVPIGAVVLLVLGILDKLRNAAEPLSGTFLHPVLTGILLFGAIVIATGLLVRSAAGRVARGALERTLFEKIPGYRLAKAFVGEGPLADHAGRAMRPALASIEDGQCPALVMDEFADGRLLVFVPASPAPMSGALYIFTPDRVEMLDTPLPVFLKAISSWGLGLREIIEGR